jgi:hypothetical protein
MIGNSPPHGTTPHSEGSARRNGGTLGNRGARPGWQCPAVPLAVLACGSAAPHGRGRLLLPDAVGDHDRQPRQQGNCKVADTGPGRGLAMIGAAVVYR